MPTVTKIKLSIWVLVFGLIRSEVVFPNPVIQNVESGSVSVNQSANTLQVDQASQKAIINWKSFNINANEHTHFQQPAGGVALNRIDPQQGVSQIYGSLTATGQLILINQAGIFFGPSAFVNVGGLIASTVDISNQNFLAGKYIFDQPGSYHGTIVNQGVIQAANYGLVALVGERVQNDGTISVHLGSVVLGASDHVTMDFSGDQLINFTVAAADDTKKSSATYRIENTGSLIADGGKIVVSAKAAGEVLDKVINMEGVVQANSVGQRGGEIILSAGAEGQVRVAGKISAAGKHNGEAGGTIKILGKRVTVTTTAALDVSGKHGGDILIGGNFQGKGPELNAQTVTVEKGAVLNATGYEGMGGRVIVWSDAATRFYGSIIATGETQGGFVETSGAYLDIAGSHVNLSALSGKTGTWLLDPDNLTIQTSGPTTASASGTPIDAYTATTPNSILTVADLQNALANASVVVQTGSGGVEAGDIFVLDPITWANANTLTLSAYRNINVNAIISNATGGSLLLRADNTGTGIGNILFSAVTPQVVMSGSGAGIVNFYYNPISYTSPTDFSGHITVSGNTVFTPYMLVNNASSLSNIRTNLAGNYALGRDITLSGSFTPLGNRATPYQGKFDGQGYTINGLTITSTTPNADIGLFGATNNATIANVNLENVALTFNADNTNDSTYIGSLIGYMSGGAVTNVTVVNPTISVSGTNYGANGTTARYDVGGLIGGLFGGSVDNAATTDGTIHANININAVDNFIARNDIGGLVGSIHNNASITNSMSSTDVNMVGNLTVVGPTSGDGQINTGGLVGRSDTNAEIQGSHSSGAVNITGTLSVPAVSGSAYYFTGGLVGTLSIGNISDPSVSDSYSTSPITLHAALTNIHSPPSAYFMTGGIAGQNNAMIETSYATGPIVATLAPDGTANGYSFFIGGIAGDSFSSIHDSYSTTNISVTGTNDGGSVQVGGIVGGFVELYDRHITTSFSTGVINLQINNINGADLEVGGLAGSFIYYGSPPLATAFSDNYSTTALNVFGTNQNSFAAIGGLVGANGQTVADPGGNISNSFSQGLVNNQLTGNGNTYVGGFIGYNLPDPGVTLRQNFWDTATSGQANAVGWGSATGITGGCFGATSCANGGTVNLADPATFSSAGWNLTTRWDLIAQYSYPYLRNFYVTTPQAFSGLTAGGGNQQVNLVNQGAVLETAYTGANGFFYFLNGYSTTSPFIVYLENAAVAGNAVFKVNPMQSVNALSLDANAIHVGSTTNATIANSELAALINGITDTNILFSANGNDIVVGNSQHSAVSFDTTAPTTFNLDGNVTTYSSGSGTLTFNGPVTASHDAFINAANINIGNTLIANQAITLTANQINLFADVTATTLQRYVGLINLQNDLTLTANTIDILNGVAGAYHLTLQGTTGNNTFNLQGPFSVSALTVNGNVSGNNTLRVSTAGSPITWNITNMNEGYLANPNLIFSQIANLTGSDSGNNFIFANNGAISGLVTGSPLAINNLIYSDLSAIFNVSVGNNVNQGTVQYNGNTITTFANMNQVIGNQLGTLTLTGNKGQLVFNSYQTGYINDPLNFSYFTHFINQGGSHATVNFVAPAVYWIATGVLTVQGVPVQLIGFNPANFRGNITFINDVTPAIDPSILNRLTAVTAQIMVQSQDPSWIFLKANNLPDNKWLDVKEALSCQLIANVSPSVGGLLIGQSHCAAH